MEFHLNHKHISFFDHEIVILLMILVRWTLTDPFSAFFVLKLHLFRFFLAD